MSISKNIIFRNQEKLGLFFTPELIFSLKTMKLHCHWYKAKKVQLQMIYFSWVKNNASKSLNLETLSERRRVKISWLRKKSHLTSQVLSSVPELIKFIFLNYVVIDKVQKVFEISCLTNISTTCRQQWMHYGRAWERFRESCWWNQNRWSIGASKGHSKADSFSTVARCACRPRSVRSPSRQLFQSTTNKRLWRLEAT